MRICRTQPTAHGSPARPVFRCALPQHVTAHTLAGEMGNLVVAESAQSAETHCMRRFLDGQGDLSDDMQGLHNPFVLSEDFEPLLQGLDPAAPPPRVQGQQTFDWLPDLATAQVGMPKQLNAYQVRGVTGATA